MQTLKIAALIAALALPAVASAHKPKAGYVEVDPQTNTIYVHPDSHGHFSAKVLSDAQRAAQELANEGTPVPHFQRQRTAESDYYTLTPQTGTWGCNCTVVPDSRLSSSMPDTSMPIGLPYTHVPSGMPDADIIHY